MGHARRGDRPGLRHGILPASIDRSNLDLLGTRNAMPSVASLPSTLTLIDGILAARSVEQITAAMTAAGEEAYIPVIPDATITPSERRELLHPDARGLDPRGPRRQPGGVDTLASRGPAGARSPRIWELFATTSRHSE